MHQPVGIVPTKLDLSPDLDAERALVVSELTQTGFVIGEVNRPGFGKETHGSNGGGDPYFTDGQVAALTIVDVKTLPIFSCGHIHNVSCSYHVESELTYRRTHSPCQSAAREILRYAQDDKLAFLHS